MWYKNICSAPFSFVTMHACDRRTDGQRDGRTELRLQDRPRICSRGKNLENTFCVRMPWKMLQTRIQPLSMKAVYRRSISVWRVCQGVCSRPTYLPVAKQRSSLGNFFKCTTRANDGPTCQISPKSAKPFPLQEYRRFFGQT